jgi:putative transposase
MLVAEGCKIGRRHVKTRMKRMGIEALYRRPRTTKPEPGHKIYPYLLRGTEITRPNQVWAMEITYIPMPRGFVYLAVVLDWFSRRVLSWRLSITMDATFCVETLEYALARHGKPDIFNTDHGSQFTGAAFTGALANNGIAISMDGRPGGTTCSSSDYGAASNTRRCTCEPTTACPRPALRSAAIWTSTTAADRMRALTAPHPIKPTSPRCPSAWQPNHGRGSTYRRGKSVQTTGTTSHVTPGARGMLIN